MWVKLCLPFPNGWKIVVLPKILFFFLMETSFKGRKLSTPARLPKIVSASMSQHRFAATCPSFAGHQEFPR